MPPESLVGQRSQRVVICATLDRSGLVRVATRSASHKRSMTEAHYPMIGSMCHIGVVTMVGSMCHLGV